MGDDGEKTIFYPRYYIGLIIFTILLDDDAFNQIRPIFGSLFDDISDEYEYLKIFITKHKNVYGISNQMCMVNEIRESKLYNIFQKICKERKYVDHLKASYNISRSKWKDLDGNSDEGMRNFSILKNDNGKKNNCICGKEICNNIIIHHKTLDIKIVIGNICIDGYDKKEIMFEKLDCSGFHSWIKSLFHVINVIKKEDNTTLKYFAKSKPFIEKCLNDRIITKEERDKYEGYHRFYSMRGGTHTLLIKNLRDLKIITNIFKKICDKYLHPSKGDYREKYEIKNILKNKNILLKYDNIRSEYLKELQVLDNGVDYDFKHISNNIDESRTHTEYVFLPKVIIYKTHIIRFNNFTIDNQRGMVEYMCNCEREGGYHKCIDCDIYYKLDESNNVYRPRCPKCYNIFKDWNESTKSFISFKNPYIITDPFEYMDCSKCGNEFKYNILKHYPIPEMDNLCKKCC